MADWDEVNKKLTIKIVYYGPALSGKTTNLMKLHDLFHADLIGNLMTLETKNDRTLFFDLLPLGFLSSSNTLVKFKLFTVPGQVAHDSTRKAVLSRSDGIIFVADSQQTQSINNAESFDNLADNVSKVGLDFESLPLVVQFNKRDAKNIVTEQEINSRWGVTKWPVIFASAIGGLGVIETLQSLLIEMYEKLNPIYRLEELGIDKSAFVHVALGNVQTQKTIQI